MIHLTKLEIQTITHKKYSLDELPDRFSRHGCRKKFTNTIDKMLDEVDTREYSEMNLIRLEVSTEVLDGLKIAGSGLKKLVKRPNDCWPHPGVPRRLHPDVWRR